MAAPVSFANVNQELNFAANNPISIDDVLVRALTGLPLDIPPKSSISFADLSGKIGVGPITGPTSNTQASFWPVTAVLNKAFTTDVYQANVVWSVVTTAGTPPTWSANGKNISLSLTEGTVGTVSCTANVTATLYYGNTLIGSNSQNVSLSAQLYNADITLSTSHANSLVYTTAGYYSAQTATMSVTAAANVPNATIVLTASPNTGYTVSGNTLTFSARSTVPGTNTASYVITAAVSSNGTLVGTGSVNSSVSATLYSSALSIGVSANSVTSVANVGPVSASIAANTSSSGNGQQTFAWSLSPNTTGLVLTPNGANSTVSESIAANVYSYVSDSANLTVQMFADAGQTLLVNTAVVPVSINLLAAGLTFSPAANVTVSGFTAQTASTTANATSKAGAIQWNFSSGSGQIITGAGTQNSSAQFSSSRSTAGSNNQSWTYSAAVVAGNTSFASPSATTTVSATMQVYNPTIIGPTSNAQYANSGTVSASVPLTLSSPVPPGANVVWSLSPSNGSTLSANGANAVVTFTSTAFGYVTSNSVLTANCYDVSTGSTLASPTANVSLTTGLYGLTVSVVPASNTQSGYNAQTAISTGGATVQAGTLAWSTANTSGPSPTFAVSGPANSSVATWSITNSGVGSQTTNQRWSINAVDPSGNVVATSIASGTFGLTATQQAYTFSVPNYSNTAISTTTGPSLSAIVLPTCNIAGYTLTNWATSNTSGTLTSNTTAATLSYTFNLSNAAPTGSYGATVSGTLLDGSGRTVQNFSSSVNMSEFYPNPTITGTAAVSASGFTTSQTASQTYVISINPGASALSVATSSSSVVGSAPTFGTPTSNTRYWSASVSQTATNYTSGSSANFFTPTITFGSATSVLPASQVNLAVASYNPAVVVTGSNSSTAGWTGAQTAWGVETATCNASISNPVWTWGGFNTTSGAFTGSYLQGTGNNQYVAYVQTSSVGSLSGTGYPGSALLYVNGTAVLQSTSIPSITASTTKYNPALVISGPSSNSQSNLFSTSASIVLTASANASIPGVSYTVSAALASGSGASVSYGSGNTSVTISNSARNNSVSSTYNVTFSVYTNGTLLQSATRQVTLTSTAPVPSYSVTTPANVTSAGFNTPQTASSTCNANGLTTSGDYVVWSMNVTSGSAPAWSTPGGSNSYITTSLTQGSIGANNSTVYQQANFYDPQGYLIQTIYSNQYSLNATVYNPALTLTIANNAYVSGTTTVTARSYATVGANSSFTSAGGTCTLSLAYSSGSTATIINTIGPPTPQDYIQVVASPGQTNSATYIATTYAQINSQTVQGPVALYLNATAASSGLSASLSPTSVQGNASGLANKGSVTSSSCTTTATGGSGSYTYSWHVSTGSTDGGQVVATNPTGQTTSFSASNISGASGSAYCTVSDGTTSVNTNTVTIGLTYTGNK